MSGNRRLGEMVVAELFAQWPQTALLFLAQGTACAGCALAPFCTVAYAMETYGLSPDTFLAAIARVAGQPRDPGGAGRSGPSRPE